jgi:hypothetical protein
MFLDRELARIAPLAAPNLENRPRTRLTKNLALEQKTHYLAFGESASQWGILQRPPHVTAPSSRTSSITCCAERHLG